MPRFGNLFGRRKTDKAEKSGATKEVPPRLKTTTETTALSATDGILTTVATSAEKKPELYSTTGSNGIRVVTHPAEAVLDIVFVHGLTGNRDTTWTYKEEVFWPELLGDDIKVARIMTFGYDADVIKLWGMAGANTLRTHGKNLASAVSDQRRGCRERPIIFIAHSLGGLVCEQALLCCLEGNSLLDKVFQSTRGIIFMGTPHSGADLANWGYKLAKYLNVIRSTNSAILGTLRQKSEVLTAVQQQFQQLLQKHNAQIDIYCFFEEKAVVGVGLIVPEHSATLSQYPNQSIAANHMDMTKFAGKNDDGYQKVLNRVRDNLERIDVPNTNVLLDWSKEIKQTEDDKMTSEDRYCLESLSFPQLTYRRQEADKAFLDTCEWILQHPSYINWIAEERELLWIKGKPGSGKSTLTAFVYRKCQENRLSKRELNLHFFFHGRGVPLQKTPIGMFRSLLHQLYEQVSLIRSAIQDSYLQKRTFGEVGIGWEWQHEELEQLFSNALLHASQSRMITIFVDALDEAGSDTARLLAEYFLNLNTKVLAANAAAKIIISCRHYPIVASTSLEIWVEHQNNEDIRKYVDHKLISEITKPDLATLSKDEGKELINTIVKRSQGVWQWARLVVPLIIDLHRQGESLIYINEELSKVPQELGDVYEHILQKVIEPRNRARTLHLMQWVCQAERPLSVTELRFAIASDDVYISEPRQFCKDSKDFVDTDKRMERLILSLSGGLVEVKHHETETTVQFIHQSVNDFLRSSGLKYLASASILKSQDGKDTALVTSGVIGQGQDRLCKSCINYLNLKEVEHGLNHYYYGQKLKEALPFVDYATSHWFLHAEKAENFGVEQRHLIEQLGHPPGPAFKRWIKMFGKLDPGNSKSPNFGSTLLHIACVSNLRSIVRILQKDTLNTNEKDTSGNTPLHYGARWGHEELTEMLLKAGANFEAKNRYQYTPLDYAARNGHNNIVELLLSRGTDVNGKTRRLRHALEAAATNGNRTLVCILLDNGADVNAKVGDYGNALQAASSNGNEDILKLLLEKGADINAQGGEYGNALQAASLNGNADIVRLLLQKGAALNTQGGHHGNALQAASFRGDAVIVRLLLEKGANINAQGGANSNAQGGVHGNALQAASISRNIGIVELLLEKGANINAHGGIYSNALQAASAEGEEAVVRLFLEKGANINAQGGEYGTALQAALSEGKGEIVRLLLEKGAEEFSLKTSRA